MNKAYPRTFSHIGISVPNIEKAVKFYAEVFELVSYHAANKYNKR